MMRTEVTEIARQLVLFGTVCLLFGAMAGYVLGPGLVYRVRRLVRRLRR